MMMIIGCESEDGKLLCKDCLFFPNSKECKKFIISDEMTLIEVVI